MSQYDVYVQNVGRCGLGGVRGGGNIATVRLAIHTHKPDIVILTEVSEKDSLIGKKGIFRGYTCTQHDQLEARTGTVAVFIKRGEIAIVENTV